MNSSSRAPRMAFIPITLAKTPKYDVYSGREVEGPDPEVELYDSLLGYGDDAGRRDRDRGETSGDQISDSDHRAPVHSTPIFDFTPPGPAHFLSSGNSLSVIQPRTSCSSVQQRARGTRESYYESAETSGAASSKSSRLSCSLDGESGASRVSKKNTSIFKTPKCGGDLQTSRDKYPGRGRKKTPSWAGTNTSTGRSKTPSTGRTTILGSAHSRTPGSARSTAPAHVGAIPPSTIVAVVEGRGQARGEVGVAALDLRRPHLSLAQFSDTHTYTRTLTKLTVLNPLEVIIASTAVEGVAGVGGRSGLVRVLQESLADVSVTAIHRRYFKDTRGLAIIKHLAAPHCTYVERHLATKYYCLASVAALMKYIECIQHVTYAPHTLHVELSSSENTMSIEHSTCRKLELVRSLRGSWEDSLFGALRHTRTPGGTRLLRASLLQPHADVSTITARLNALQYLVDNPDLFYTLQSILGRFPDVDWLLSMCAQLHKEDTEQRCELRLNYVISLKNTLELLEPLATTLVDATDPLLDSVRQSVSREDLRELLETLRGVMHEDARLVKGAAAMRTQRCYAIKSHVNGLLDVARKIYSEIIDDITAHVENLAKDYSVGMRVGHNAARGFHIVIPVPKKASAPQLPPVIIKVQRGRGCITCTTETLYLLDQRSRDTLREILIMSNVIVSEMLIEARGRMGALHGLGEAVATLDLVVSLAHSAAIGSWVRPEFSRVLAIRCGRHPILDVLAPTPPVPNNTIGSFVPAEFASLRVVRHLFTHLGSEDSPENNASTFQVQMSDVAHMIDGAGCESLVLLDELGSGTSVEEGGSLAWAIMETLVHARATTVLATHALFLTKLPYLYPTVVNYHMESEDEGGGMLRLSHVVRRGVTQATHYGLALAAVTAVPPSVLQRSRHLADVMAPPTQVAVEEDTESLRYRAVYRLAHRLLALANAAQPALTPHDDPLADYADSSSPGASTSQHPHGMDKAGSETSPRDSRSSDAHDLTALSASRATEMKTKLECLLQDFMAQVSGCTQDAHQLSEEDHEGLQRIG
ncbi:mutS protein homolog 4-like isoform X2 [Penaeus japonicus]|uniref:mutS protein homolog 4-like isoform X2 n=1 Tax=Penaeus japonicus TaxID=27405 RepID=UPI001C70F587|nr:mutS protein homolog 4-like isoform X2 [Penaeus japonicus]